MEVMNVPLKTKYLVSQKSNIIRITMLNHRKVLFSASPCWTNFIQWWSRQSMAVDLNCWWASFGTRCTLKHAGRYMFTCTWPIIFEIYIDPCLFVLFLDKVKNCQPNNYENISYLPTPTHMSFYLLNKVRSTKKRNFRVNLKKCIHKIVINENFY